MKLTKVTNVRMPYDCRDPDPHKNYGIHGLDVWFMLNGPHGAVQFAVSFPIYLPHVECEKDWTETNRAYAEVHGREPRGFDVGYHSPKPMYEGQEPMPCELLEGGECYYDGSTLQADKWTRDIFSIRGERPEKEIWRRLANEYSDRFGVDASEITYE